MGKKIDAFIATLLPGIFVWFYFSRHFENRLIPVAAAVIACLLTGKISRAIIRIFRRIPFVHRRRIRRNSGAAMLRIACLPTDKAKEDICSLLHKCYPESKFQLEVIQQHPNLKLSEAAVFQAWKKHSGEDRLVICSSCRTEPAVRAFAASLPLPKITMIDSDMLSQMIAEHPEGMLPENTSKAPFRFRHALNLLINRKNAPRNLIFSISMLLMYGLTGNIFYLVSAAILIIFAFLSLRRKLRPQKLF